jgi:hypothetical protein
MLDGCNWLRLLYVGGLWYNRGVLFGFLLSDGFLIIFISLDIKLPVTVAELSKACTVFAPSEAAVMGSNPTQGMDV